MYKYCSHTSVCLSLPWHCSEYVLDITPLQDMVTFLTFLPSKGSGRPWLGGWVRIGGYGDELMLQVAAEREAKRLALLQWETTQPLKEAMSSWKLWAWGQSPSVFPSGALFGVCGCPVKLILSPICLTLEPRLQQSHSPGAGTRQGRADTGVIDCHS